MVNESDERGIRCPKCNCAHCPESRHEVAQTFAFGPAKSIRRIRVCGNRFCRHRFSTYERAVQVNTGIQDGSELA